MTEETTAIAVNNITAQPAGAMVCSIVAKPGDRETAAKIYNAMNNPAHRVADYINKEIDVVDYLVEMTEIANEETGEVSTVPRCVLIDAKGESYQAVSVGVANALAKLVMVCGPATWEPALKVRVKQQTTKRGSMLTLEMVG